MPQIRLFIGDRDAEFLDRLSSYIYRNKGNQFILELFTDPVKFEDWLNSDGKADFIAVSSSFLDELPVRPDPSKTLVLIDSPESLIPEEFNAVDKYISAERLIKEIISLVADKLPLRNYKDKSCCSAVYLVLYADGSDFYNPLAHSIAYLKAVDGSSSFYLNLDELSNTDSYFQGNNQKGLSEMLYYIKAKKSNLALKAEACTSKDINYGLYFMKGHQNPDDIRSMTPDECALLINSIIERSCYESVIVSRAFIQDKILPVLLNLAEKIFVTSSNFPSSLERLNKISELLSGMGDTNGTELTIGDKVCFCINSVCRTNEFYRLNNFKKIFLPHPFAENCCFPPSNEYLSAIKDLLEQ